MIEVKNLSRVFNKGKHNEVRACDNISVKLEDTGFYVIFGKSGAGKSSFMNALGGLDDYSSGTITYDDKTFKHMVSDKCRVANIGYIFQNYCLDVNSNVYDNVALGLKSIGIRDEELIFTRVMTALANVGMTKYFRRNVTALSGGQQQRVAIARAMAKGSKIILADEPTGNLDDENTRVVMNILKELSKTRMVIVVTHEVDIVETYADKIIEIHDGKIVNESDGLSKDYVHDDKNKIFLSELEKTESTVGGITIEQYGDKADVNIKVVNVNGKLYLKADNANIKILDAKSEIKLIEGTREEYKQKMQSDVSIQLKDLEPIEAKSKGRVFRFKDCVPNAKQAQAKKFKKRNKFLKIALSLLVSILVVVSAMWGGYYNQKDLRDHYRLGNQVALSYKTDKDYDIIQDILVDPVYSSKITNVTIMNNPEEDRKYVNGKEEVSLHGPKININISNFESVVDPKKVSSTADIQVNYLPIEKASDIVAGEAPKKAREVVLSKGAIYAHIETIKEGNPHYNPNIDRLMESVVGSRITIASNHRYGPGAENQEKPEYRVVGLVEGEEANVYCQLGDLIEILEMNSGGLKSSFVTVQTGQKMEVGTTDGKYGKEEITIQDGYIYIYTEPHYPREPITISCAVNGQKKELKAIYYSHKPGDEAPGLKNAATYVTENTIKEFGTYVTAALNKGGYNAPYMTSMLINAEDIETINAIVDVANTKKEDADNLKVYATSEVQKQMLLTEFDEALKIMNIIQIVMFAFIVLISTIVIFANFMEKTKEVGIYRAIGVSKSNCVYKYFVENLRTVISFVMLVILIVGGLFMINSYFPLSEDNPILNGTLLYFSWWQLLGVTAIIIPILMLISIIPTLKYIRKSPIKILSEYDM